MSRSDPLWSFARDRRAWRALHVEYGPWRLWFPGMWHARIAIYLWLRRQSELECVTVVGDLAAVLDPPYDNRRFRVLDLKDYLLSFVGYALAAMELFVTVILVAILARIFPAAASVSSTVSIVIIFCFGLLWLVSSVSQGLWRVPSRGIRTMFMAESDAVRLLRREVPAVLAVLARGKDRETPLTVGNFLRRVGAASSTGVVIDRRRLGSRSTDMPTGLVQLSSGRGASARYMLSNVPDRVIRTAREEAEASAKMPVLELRRPVVVAIIAMLFVAAFLAGPGDGERYLRFEPSMDYWSRYLESVRWSLDTLLGTDLTSTKAVGVGVGYEVILRLGWLVLIGVGVNIGSQLLERRRHLTVELLTALVAPTQKSASSDAAGSARKSSVPAAFVAGGVATYLAVRLSRNGARGSR